MRDRFCRKVYISYFLVLLSLGDSGCSGCYGINQTAAMEASSHIVVAWFLPCDFGGSFVEQESGRRIDLPFTLLLDSFRVEHYPGTEAPADYVSHIRILRSGQDTDSASCSRTVSMNRILSEQGFRFYQSSFEDDGQGSWLTVNYDYSSTIGENSAG